MPRKVRGESPNGREDEGNGGWCEEVLLVTSCARSGYAIVAIRLP